MENWLTREIYDHSPVFLQNLYASVYGLQKKWCRYRGEFRKYYDFFAGAAGWSLADFQAYQDEKVRGLIRNAYEHVPFHRRRMDEWKVRPDDIRGVVDLPRLPLLEKSEVRAAGREMLSKAVPEGRLLSATTSGSTGYPLTLYWTRSAKQKEYGFHWARRRRHVIRGDSYGSVTGLQLVPSDSLKPPFWRHNWAANQTCYSLFHITPKTIPLYLEEMQRCQHVYLEGYPSVIAMFARHLLEQGLDWPRPLKAYYVESEQLQEEHRWQISQAFKTRVYNMYGQAEFACSITEYDCGHLHYDMDYGVIEFMPTGREGDCTVAEIVCTAFDNAAWPLIRYRVGDLVLIPDEPVQCSENAGLVVRAIYGRTGHSLVSRDGRRINNISVIIKKCRNIEAVQCVQHEPGLVEVHVVRSPGYAAQDEENLLYQFHQKMGEMDFKFVYLDGVDQFERTPAGKFLSIISRIPPGQRLTDGVAGP